MAKKGQKQKKYSVEFKISVILDMLNNNLREKKNMTQQRLAIELDMNQNTISRYESGKRQADYATLIKIADYFNVSIDYLLERTNNPQRYKDL